MALVTLNRVRSFPGNLDLFSANTSVAADVAMSSAGHYVCGVFRAHRAMTITHVGFYPQAATGSPTATYTIETVNASDGLPSGTLWNAAGGGSTVTTGTLVATTWALSALAASAVIAQSNIFAVKIAMASGTTLTSGRLAGLAQFGVAPYQVNNTGAAAKTTNTAKLMAIGESSTSFVYLDGMFPVITVTNNAFNNTNSAKRGARFQVPYKCLAVALRLFQNAAVGDMNVLIMDDAGTDLGGTSKLIDKDQYRASTSGFSEYDFAASVVLTAGTWYRIAIEPTSATNCSISTMTLPTLDYRSGMPGGTNFFYTTFASAAWDDTNTNMVPMMDLVIGQLDDGVSVGGGGGSVFGAVGGVIG